MGAATSRISSLSTAARVIPGRSVRGRAERQDASGTTRGTLQESQAG